MTRAPGKSREDSTQRHKVNKYNYTAPAAVQTVKPEAAGQKVVPPQAINIAEGFLS
jgi:hypothetical protein